MFFNSAKEINRRRNEINGLLMAYRKTGTRDPSETLAGPYKNRKNQDPSGTLQKSEIRNPTKTGKPGPGTLAGS